MENVGLRKLMLGRDAYFPDWSLYKRVILISRFSIIAITVSVFYYIFDYYNDALLPWWVYANFGIAASISLVCNRLGYYKIATTILLTFANVTGYLMFEMGRMEAGAYQFFLINIIAAFALFSGKDKYLRYGFAGLSLVLFVLAFYLHFNFIPAPVYLPDNNKIVFFLNFLFTVATVVMIIYFLIRVNEKSEESLIDSKKCLKVLMDELSISKRRFELAIMGSSSGIWDWDMEKRELYTSPMLTDLLGMPQDGLVKMDPGGLVQNLVHPDDQSRFRESLAMHLEKREPFWVEVRMKHLSGEYIWVLDAGQAEWDENGKPIRMVGSVVDISRRKAAEKKVKEQNTMLEKANAELDRFVYSTSHDLKAPLSSVMGLIRIFELTENEEEKQQCLDMMKERIDTLNQFIKDIIDYSRNSRLSLEKEEVSLNKLVSDALINIQYFEQSQKIRIEKQNLGIVFSVDKSRLKIILNNILTNAIKYHNVDQEDPNVFIGASVKDDMLQLEIRDNGIGIADELKEQIFDMFFRATESSEGSGLGLYIAKEMADKLGGSITVESEFGVGTRFVISIPVGKQ
ncbi:ATP-binding protein [Fulvivirga maritima]|uniref:sensor histidine kinase n=1 Tax=Fulvivirga maritima TaxID=2904247 RepID=UPI001F20DD8A|nr:HAMP domain-containing sensor histidine kinase [Fulvivirga maritima]UII28526.1 ATP-binding protein [Fulvivirga maritima]